MHVIGESFTRNLKRILYFLGLFFPLPDYVSVPKSQEDDIHNVQSVIDSLALDYLQISLSHITGADWCSCHGYVFIR